MKIVERRPDDNDPFSAGWNACHEAMSDEIEQWRKLNSERVDEITGLIHRLREAATEIERLRADNLRLVALTAAKRGE
jgi:hypothetical protein